MITASALLAIMPKCPRDRAPAYAHGLSVAMAEASITTVTRGAAFLAQLAHESCELSKFAEDADGSQYEGAVRLGNSKPGDGRRYKGRGPIQLTGRTNYHNAGLALGVDLEGTPELASEPEIGFRVAAWFWTAGAWRNFAAAAKQRLGEGPVNLNEIADRLDVMGCTLAVNGGLNGYQQRVAYYHRALEVLGLNAPVIA